MELTWSTFFLEIVNFLVLVWLLKRFLYRPIMNVVTQRKAEIDKAMADAQALRGEAKTLLDQYHNRLADWEREKEGAKAKLRDELNAEGVRRKADLLASLEEEREKARVLEARRMSEVARASEVAALAQAARFAARLLSRVAGPELESRLVDFTAEELSALPEEQQQALREACTGADLPVKITSAYPLNQRQRTHVTQAIGRFFERPVPCEFSEDSCLMAGLRIAMGAWVLQANLQDELKFFAEFTPHVG